MASVHQFQLEDTATTMDADDWAMQSTLQDMEAAVAVILQEIGEDIERPVSLSCACEHVQPCSGVFYTLLHNVQQLHIINMPCVCPTSSTI